MTLPHIGKIKSPSPYEETYETGDSRAKKSKQVKGGPVRHEK